MNGIDAETVSPALMTEDPPRPNDPAPPVGLPVLHREEDPSTGEALPQEDPDPEDSEEDAGASVPVFPQEESAEPDQAAPADPSAPAAHPEDTDPGRSEPPPFPGSIRPGLAWLRAAVPWTLAALASFVFAASALTAVKEAELSREKIGRFLLGAVFGGRESVKVILPEPPPDGPLSEADAQGETEGVPSHRVPIGSLSAEPDELLRDEEDRAEDAALLSAEQPLPGDGGNVSGEEALPAKDAGQPPFLCPADLYLTNETAYSPDSEELLSLPRAIPPLDELRERWGPDAPFVLILHTHGTEAYAECADSGWRSRDPSLSVVALGERLAEKLREADIPAIHLTACFDAPDFNMAYYNAAQAIREALALAPSVSYILDIHRDSITLPDGTAYAPVTDAEGVPAARLMFVVGTDEAGADHPGWRDNLALALRLQTALSARYPALMRDVNLRSASFNEQYSKGSLLIEAGAAGCTLGEAMTAVDLLSDALIAEIRGDE